MRAHDEPHDSVVPLFRTPRPASRARRSAAAAFAVSTRCARVAQHPVAAARLIHFRFRRTALVAKTVRLPIS